MIWIGWCYFPAKAHTHTLSHSHHTDTHTYTHTYAYLLSLFSNKCMICLLQYLQKQWRLMNISCIYVWSTSSKIILTWIVNFFLSQKNQWRSDILIWFVYLLFKMFHFSLIVLIGTQHISYISSLKGRKWITIQR